MVVSLPFMTDIVIFRKKFRNRPLNSLQNSTFYYIIEIGLHGIIKSEETRLSPLFQGAQP